MDLLKGLLAVEHTVVSDLEALIPDSVKQEMGAAGAAFVANIKYDLAAAKSAALTFGKAEVEKLWTGIKQTAKAILQDAPDLASLAYEHKIGAILDIIKADAMGSELGPMIQSLSTATLEMAVRSAGSMIMAGVLKAAVAAAVSAA